MPAEALNILLIEDNAGDALLIHEMLKDTGAQFTMERTHRLSEGLEALSRGRFSAVLLDLSLPDSHGFQTFKQLQNHAPQIPVIVLTGLNDENVALGAMQSGAQDYLIKGRVDGDSLLRIIRHSIERKLLEEALRQARNELERRVEERTAKLAESEARALEAWKEAERANRVKDEFLAVLSHELRTPLSAMLGWVKILQNGRSDEGTTRKGLSIIERNIKAQTHIIEDLLDVSRIIAGKMKMAKEPLELVAITRDSIENCNETAAAKQISLNFETRVAMLPIEGDQARLQQLLLNLVSNAIKFTPAGGRVDVRIAVEDDRAVLRVSDTGRGISPTFLPKIFDRFAQEDSSSGRRFAGLGLGLAITRHIVQAHGGSISAHSAGEGMGALFEVSLPLIAGSQTGPTQADCTNAVGALPLKGAKILIVEDNDDVRELLMESLSMAGAETGGVGSTRDALAMIEHFRPSVLVSDIGLPEQDGYVLIQTLRDLEKEEARAQTPAIALTGYAQPEDMERVKAAGYQAHMTKPIDPEALVRSISAILSTLDKSSRPAESRHR